MILPGFPGLRCWELLQGLLLKLILISVKDYLLDSFRDFSQELYIDSSTILFSGIFMDSFIGPSQFICTISSEITPVFFFGFLPVSFRYFSQVSLIESFWDLFRDFFTDRSRDFLWNSFTDVFQDSFQSFSKCFFRISFRYSFEMIPSGSFEINPSEILSGISLGILSRICSGSLLKNCFWDYFMAYFKILLEI